MSKKLKSISQRMTPSPKSDPLKKMIQIVLHCDDGTELANFFWTSDLNKRAFVTVVFGTIIALGQSCRTCKCSLYNEATRHTLDFVEHGLRLIGMHQLASLIRGDFGSLLEKFHCNGVLEAEMNKAFELIRNQAPNW